MPFAIATLFERLALAMPPALAVRFGKLGHCMEASVVAARILRARGINARSVPCAVRVFDEGTYCVTAGYSRAEIMALMSSDHEPEYVGDPDDSKSFHVVIEAHPTTGRTIIDLTIGQLTSNAQTVVAPIESGWPAVQCGEWTIEYDPSPRADEIAHQVALAEGVAYEGLRATSRI
jgi:hypothetical protein